jgi:tetratricopeptide (TPR) repeat protein
MKKGKRKALIVAISEYDKLNNLDFCKNDGEAINSILLLHNYEIPEEYRLIGRVDGHMLREKIIDFFTNPEVTLGDTLLFYYSGHGVPDSEGRVYLCASEIDADYPYRRGFSFQDFTDMMNRSLSKKIVAILDCCFSGTAEISKGSENDAAKLGNAAILKGSNALIEGEGRCILASSQANQEAYALMEEYHSVFTHFLIRGLNGEEGAVDKYGYVTPDSLGRFIYDGIMSLPVGKRPKQKPVRKMDISGEIVIASYPEKSRNGKILEKEPSIDDIGKQYLDKKEYKQALEYYGRLIIDPSKVELWTNKGIAYHKLGNNSEALKCFEIAVALDPTNAKAWGLKGTTLFNLEKYEDALKDLQKSIDLGSTDENTWFGKGMSLYKLGKLEEALSCMNKSLEINSKANLAMTYKGEILKVRGKHEQSLYWFDEALKVDSTLPLPWYFKACLLSELDRKEEANYCFDKAIEYFENYPMSPGIDTVWNPKGNNLADLGRHNDALQCYNNAIKVNPRNPIYWINKGVTLRTLNLFNEAEKCAEEAIKFGRNNNDTLKMCVDLMNAIGFSHFMSNRRKEAIACLDKVIDLDSSDSTSKYKKLMIENPNEMKKIIVENFQEFTNHREKKWWQR